MASSVCHLQEHDTSEGSSKLEVTILASEWGFSNGCLSAINREFAIQLAKFSCINVTFFVPKFLEEERKAAESHGISILEAEKRPGFSELDWLTFPPEDLTINVVVGHGVTLGRQAQIICKSHKCKWVQVVHSDVEAIGMFHNQTSNGEEGHEIEVELCKMADFVVGLGPKLTEAFRTYLSHCRKSVFEFTPGVFDDLASLQQDSNRRKWCSVLIFGHGDADEFELKGFDIAAKSVAALTDTCLVYVGAPHGKRDEIIERFVACGIPKERLRLKGYMDTREALKQLFCRVDLLLMPSRTEGFGLTGLEAMSAGLPVIVSKNSGFGEALHSLPFGASYVIDSEDPRRWEEAIKGIWNKNRMLRLNEVKALRNSYDKKYNWAEQCKCLIGEMVKLF